MNDNYKILNLAAQESAEESHLKVYKEVLKLRNSNVWRYGEYESQSLNSGKVLGFTRQEFPDFFQISLFFSTFFIFLLVHNSKRNFLHNCRIAPRDVDPRSFLVLVNMADESVSVDSSRFRGVPQVGFVLIRSVGFEGSTVG